MKLSYRMREELRDLKRRKDAFAADPTHFSGGCVSTSNTNGTMCALEKRGLVQSSPHPRVSLNLLWRITEAGEVAISKQS